MTLTAYEPVSLSVSEFVALLNQALEYAFPTVIVSGELANFRVSKSKWLYFDLKDDESLVRCFGTVYQLPGPLEDGMLLNVRAQPRLHPRFGFSLNVQAIQPAGEGTIKRAAELVQAKLAAEGLFDEERKRLLPYPPQTIGLITSVESAAYADFCKIVNARWTGLDIMVRDVQVQGEAAPEQVCDALEFFNESAEPPDIIVLIRGGGSLEDLQAFSDERVTRAVAASRAPTIVAIGHETDVSLAELAADRRASTPSNAAELITPDKYMVLENLQAAALQLDQNLSGVLAMIQESVRRQAETLALAAAHRLQYARESFAGRRALLEALNPRAVLRRGYAIARYKGQLIRQTAGLKSGDIVDIELSGNQHIQAAVKRGK